DQSSVEANSIAATFPGLSAGEQKCDVILCTVHVVRTWIKNIYHGPTLEKMTRAMHKLTQIGCDEVVKDAIANCPVQANAKYIAQLPFLTLSRFSYHLSRHFLYCLSCH